MATLLVVEDDPAILEGMSKTLAQAGYTVVTAANGQEALDRLQETTPDLILADIMMPVMDGYAFYRALRANPAWELVPFVFATAKSQPHEIREGKRLGVDDYLVKPFEAEDLLVTVEAKLRRVHGIRQASQHEMQVLKDRILTLLNHELRTPLTHIRGYAELLGAEGSQLDAATLTQFLAGINVGGQRLGQLVEDLLLVVEIEGGQAAKAYNYRKTRLESLDELVAAVAESFEARAAQAEVTLRLEAPPGLPPVEADVDYLSDALARLLDNAIKFSAPGVVVEIHAGAQDGIVVITVTDQGRGVPLEEQPFIFDVFHQVDRGRYEQQGAGLGLTIARGLVELHGGWIEVESQENVGSSFRIVLPAAT